VCTLGSCLTIISYVSAFYVQSFFFLLSLAYAQTSLDVKLHANVQNKSSAIHSEISVILCDSILILIRTIIKCFVAVSFNAIVDCWNLTLILLTWGIWRACNNASRWQMGVNSVFVGLN